MSAAYSAMVRSLENLPELATLRIALRAQASGSWYRAPTFACVCGVGGQVGQVHVEIAVGQQRVAGSGGRCPARAG